jgi:phage tail-like protein
VTEPAPKLLDYLPAIYQEDYFLKQFLQAFDDILFGTVTEPKFPAEGIEQTIAQIPKLFDPQTTPEDFLSWLAEWTVFSIRNDLDLRKQRDFIAQVIPLYRRRGNMNNLKDLLSIFVSGEPTIIEPGVTEFQIGKTSNIGKDTFIAGGVPHYFEVEINIPGDLDNKLIQRQIEIASALIDLEKPAHTYYKLTPKYLSTIQIGKLSKLQAQIGINTFLGTRPKTP